MPRIGVINVLNFFCCLLISCSAHAYVVDGLRIHNPALLQYAKKSMPKTGTLKVTNKGFVYVDIDKHYVKGILKQLKNSRYTMNRELDHAGAHILVMLQDEVKGKHIKEFGKNISFKPLGFYSVVKDDKEYFMLAIDAPELAKLRAKYGLVPKPDGHTFHITLGVRKFKAEREDELAGGTRFTL